jgi:hypothetical protein
MARQLTREELEARQREHLAAERRARRAEQQRLAKARSDQETEFLLARGPAGDFLDSEGEEGAQEREEEVDEKNEEDEDWDDGLKMPKYNTLKLLNFARECDRYGFANRAAAKLGNALMKDLDLVTKADSSKLLCPGKVRRERLKWGGVLEQEHRGKAAPGGLYFDGKKCPTLTWDTSTVEVQVRGAKGRAAKKNVVTTSIKSYQQEHITCVSEPGGQYLSHITPMDGKARSTSKELVCLVRERNIDLDVMGGDGCKVNTGKNNGVIRLTELELEKPVQHIICLLHLNELPFRHELCNVDGVTSGPDSYTGRIGSSLMEDVWTLPVVSFEPVPGQMPVLSEDQLKDTSRDQFLLYRLAHAVQSGVVPEEVAGATIGPLMHARWITTVARALRKACSTRRRTKAFTRIIQFIVNLYAPAWFSIKNKPHCQSGALHFYKMIELSRELGPESQATVQKVLQDNSFWAHPENIIIACLADPHEEIRRKAVLYIMAARRDFDPASNPRQFLTPQVNFEVSIF